MANANATARGKRLRQHSGSISSTVIITPKAPDAEEKW